MRRPYHYRRPNPDRRRALELLAASRKGCTKAMMRAHGFSIDMLLDLLKAGLATTKRERMVDGGRISPRIEPLHLSPGEDGGKGIRYQQNPM
jgi:hypothetical protein